jgi:hypothetical protein
MAIPVQMALLNRSLADAISSRERPSAVKVLHGGRSIGLMFCWGSVSLVSGSPRREATSIIIGDGK